MEHPEFLNFLSKIRDQITDDPNGLLDIASALYTNDQIEECCTIVQKLLDRGTLTETDTAIKKHDWLPTISKLFSLYRDTPILL
jgi:hypothetical protein